MERRIIDSRVACGLGGGIEELEDESVDAAFAAAGATADGDLFDWVDCQVDVAEGQAGFAIGSVVCTTRGGLALCR